MDSSSHILLIGSGLKGGGAEGRFSRLVSALFDGQCSVALLTGKSDDVPIENVLRFYFLGWRNQWSYLRIVPRFWWLVWRDGYHMIFAFGLFPCLVAACATLGRKKQVRLIVSEITRPQREDDNAGFVRRRLYRYLRRFAYRRAYLLTANSLDGVREMCAIAGVAPEKGRRVMNIVDHERLRQRAEEMCAFAPPSGRYFICVSRFEPMKRLDTVIAAMALLPEHANAHLLIIGDGPARAVLVGQVARLGLASHVHFSGWLRNPAPLVRKAAALILASEYEGFSNSVLEAMFLDTPVITSLCSADAEEMCSEGAALGFTVGDERALAAAMVEVLTNPESAERLSENARRYRQPHAMENSLLNYEKIILAAYA